MALYTQKGTLTALVLCWRSWRCFFFSSSSLADMSHGISNLIHWEGPCFSLRACSWRSILRRAYRWTVLMSTPWLRCCWSSTSKVAICSSKKSMKDDKLLHPILRQFEGTLFVFFVIGVLVIFLRLIGDILLNRFCCNMWNKQKVTFF